MKQIIVLAQETERLNLVRCEALRGVMERMYSLEGHETPASEWTKEDMILALQALGKEALLSFRPGQDSATDIWYIPSRDSIHSVWSSTPNNAWDNKILEQHRNMFRESQGAIFRLPLAEGDGFIEAFITDWSPFPAAAAVAIHKNHPVACQVGKRDGNYFTGKFVHHPITGDLLPVWVASWVQPEFGTGAVIVNPAHDYTDLSFAREVGLPIRFGLVPHAVTSDPETWPRPPVIKQGTTTKTGRFDGLSVAEAIERYFDTLSEGGFAEKHTSRTVGAWKIASYMPDSDGHVVVCEHCGQLAVARGDDSNARCQNCGKACERVSLEPSGLFQALLSVDDKASLVLIVPSGELETALLFGRLLFFDLKKQPLLPVEIQLVQRVQETKASEGIEADMLELGSLIRAPLSQMAVLKQQVFDQLARFKRVHSELLEGTSALPMLPDELEGPLWKAARQTKKSLLGANLQNAFSSVYRLQKQLGTLSPEARQAEGALCGYYAVAYVLAGYPYPNALNILEVWNRI